MKLSMSGPDIGEAEIAAVMQVLRSPSLSIGPALAEFERGVAEYVGARHAVGVSSGTAGLHLSVIGAGVTDGDLVITTPFSFVASANCILYERGVPVFVDVDRDTGNIDARQVGAAADALVNGGEEASAWLPPGLRAEPLGRLKAVLPVHTFGQPADLDGLLDVARRHDLALIEDACEAIGAEHNGRRVGSLGDSGVFAFYPNKQMTTGEGGVVVTNRDDLAALLRSLRNQGRDVFDVWLHHTRLGFNYRLNELSAALGRVQLQRIEELLANRDRVAGWYNERLTGFEAISRPCVKSGTSRMSWFVYVIRLAPPADRNAVMAALAERGIPSRPYFTPIHLQPFYRERFGYGPGDFPNAEALGEQSLALPFSGVMTEDQVDLVCAELGRIVQTAAVPVTRYQREGAGKAILRQRRRHEGRVA